MNLSPLRCLALSAGTTALLALTACGDKAAEAPAPAPAATPAPAPAAAPAPAPEPAPAPAPAPAAADPSAKLNVYIDCFNETHERANQAMERYASWVKDMKAGPTGKERTVYGTYTILEHTLAKCNQPVLNAIAAQPALPELDAAAKAYAETIQAWGKTLVEADKYYSRENYKDDQMAQGKAMHPDIVKNYDAYNAATKAFSAALEAENDKVHLAELAAVEKAEGRKYQYWHMSTMIAAKQLVNLIAEDKFDVEAANAKLKAYEQASDSLVKYTKEPGAQAPMTFVAMEHLYEQFLVAAKQRIRRVRDNQAYSSGEKMNLSNGSGWMVEGSPDHLVREYNQLIENSNRMN